MSDVDFVRKPNKDYPYFLWDPAEGEVTYYRTEQERDQVAVELLESYDDDGEWCEDVDRLSRGVMTSFVAVQNPDTAEEYGYEYDWSDMEAPGDR